MANSLERLVNLQEEMATNINNFLRVQRTHRRRKSTRTKQICEHAEEIIYFEPL